MCERLGKENLKVFYYPLQALLARENTITMHNGHKQVNGESIDFYDVAAPKVALNSVFWKICKRECMLFSVNVKNEEYLPLDIALLI